MKQITLDDEVYKALLEKLHENTYGYGYTQLERIVMENTKDVIEVIPDQELEDTE